MNDVQSSSERSDGIYTDILEADYHRMHMRTNASLLKLVAAETPMHARTEQLLPTLSTPAQTFGTAAHLAVLQPELFSQRVIEGLGIARRSNANKAEWAEFEEEHAGKIILKPDEFARCAELAARVHRHEKASSLLDAPGKREVTALFMDPSSGLPCRSRFDLLCHWNGWNVIADLKSCESATDDAVAKAIANFGYAFSAAFYLFAAETLAPVDRKFYWIFVEKKKPGVRVVEIDPQDLYEGQLKFRRALDTWARCVNNDSYPGWEEIEVIQQARWARMSDQELDADEEMS